MMKLASLLIPPGVALGANAADIAVYDDSADTPVQVAQALASARIDNKSVMTNSTPSHFQKKHPFA